MPTQKTRQEIIDKLSQCGNLSYKDMVDLLYSIFFLSDEIDPEVFLSRLTGRWTQAVANKGKYDTDFFVSYNEKIYRSSVNNNVSVPGVSPTWIIQSDPVTSSFGFKGNATTDTNPGVPTAPEFWIGSAGTYPNFGNKTITGVSGFLVFMNGGWSVANMNIDLTQYKKKTDPVYAMYPTTTDANNAIPNSLVNGVNGRDGSTVLIGTTGSYTEYWWTGSLSNSELVEKGKAYPYLNDQNISLSETSAGAINTVGADLSLSTLNRTKYLPVIPGQQIDYVIRNSGANSLFFYDSNKVFISSTATIGSTATTISGTAYAPANSAFVRVQGMNSTNANYASYTFSVKIYGILNRIGSIPKWTPTAFKSLSQSINNGVLYEAQRDTLSTEEPGVVADTIWKALTKDPLLYGVTLSFADTEVNGINSTGADFTFATINRTKYIPIRKGMSIDYTLRNSGGSSIFFYDVNKVFISSTVAIGSTQITVSGTAIAPDNSYYFRAQSVNSGNANYQPYTFSIKTYGVLGGSSSSGIKDWVAGSYAKDTQVYDNGKIWKAVKDNSSRPGDFFAPAWIQILSGQGKVERANANIFNPYDIRGYGIKLSGLVADANFYSTDMIEWGDAIRIATNIVPGSSVGYTVTFAQYDENYNYISGSLLTDRRFDKATNAKYFRIGTTMAEKNTLVITPVAAGALYATTNDPYELQITSLYDGTKVTYGLTERQLFTNKVAIEARPYMGTDGIQDRFTFFYFSDIHYNPNVTLNQTKNFNEMVAFSTHPLIAPYIDAIICGGDVANGNDRTAQSITLSEIAIHMTNMLSVNNVPVLNAIGNHDDNINTVSSNAGGAGSFAAAIPKQTQYDLMISPLAAKWPGTMAVAGKGYYYYDFVAKGIRVITLDCFDLPLVDDGTGKLKYVGGMYYSQAQIDWLFTTLQNTPAGYAVVINNHVAFPAGYTAGAIYFQGNDFIPRIINAFKNGTTYAHSYTNPTFPALNTNKSFAFSTQGQFVCYLAGHIHSPKLIKDPLFADQNTIIVACTKSDDTGNMIRVGLDEYRNSFGSISINKRTKIIAVTTFGAYKDSEGTIRNRVNILNF